MAKVSLYCISDSRIVSVSEHSGLCSYQIIFFCTAARMYLFLILLYLHFQVRAKAFPTLMIAVEQNSLKCASCRYKQLVVIKLGYRSRLCYSKSGDQRMVSCGPWKNTHS